MILQGRVTVDGQVVRELGTKVDPARQKVAVDGQRIHEERMVYYAVSKPKGYVSTNHDPAGKPRVIDILPEIPERVYAVGRLDEQSIGLMLLTNDGAMANRLAHPKYGVEKLYKVVVAGRPNPDVLKQLTDGVWLAEGKVRAKRVRVAGTQGEATVLEMTLAEGKNREVRRMLATLGHKVMSLIRIAVGPITLKGLSPGQYRPLTPGEVGLLRKVAAGIPVAPLRSYDRNRSPGRVAPSRTSSVGQDQRRVRRPAGPGSSTGPGPGTGPRPGAGRIPRVAGGPPPTSTGPSPSPTRGPQRAPVRPHPASMSNRRPAPSGPTGARPPHPAGPPPSQRPRPGTGPGLGAGPGPGTASGGLPPLPSGPPPSQRPRPGPGSGPPPRPRLAHLPRPEVDEPRRRIIGMDRGPTGSDGPRPRKPMPRHRPHPRSDLGPRRPRPLKDDES